jgi:hypothetical protein
MEGTSTQPHRARAAYLRQTGMKGIEKLYEKYAPILQKDNNFTLSPGEGGTDGNIYMGKDKKPIIQEEKKDTTNGD